jgi:hypothetical protein
MERHTPKPVPAKAETIPAICAKGFTDEKRPNSNAPE